MLQIELVGHFIHEVKDPSFFFVHYCLLTCSIRELKDNSVIYIIRYSVLTNLYIFQFLAGYISYLWRRLSLLYIQVFIFPLRLEFDFKYQPDL